MKLTGYAAFCLLLIGTVGLLLNEFVFTWGRTATLLFAAANVMGLVLLVIAFRRQDDPASD